MVKLVQLLFLQIVVKIISKSKAWPIYSFLEYDNGFLHSIEWHTLYTKDNSARIHLVPLKWLRCEGRTLMTEAKGAEPFSWKPVRKQTADIANLCGEDGGFDVLCSEYGWSKYITEKTMDLYLKEHLYPHKVKELR